MVGDLAAQIFRVSFTGEMSYEINVPSGCATALVEKIVEAGAPFGIAPVGIDAWMLLRTEKGYLHVGGDTDGTTVPDDVGWGHVIRRKDEFVGKRSLSLPANTRADRLQLVGLQMRSSALPTVGSHLCAENTPVSVGQVTSAGFSPALGKPVALAMVSAGRARMGETVDVHSRHTIVKARIAANCAYDAEGTRLDA
jgi:sarcosine oxidase subunit alpha